MSTDNKARGTRDGILDAAIDLFIKDGFAATPMDAIALAANVAKGTLYYHFASKEGIVDAIVERYAATMEARLAAIEADAGLGFVEKLAAFVLAVKELNNAAFSRLHRMRYIDIHDKTGRVMVERFAPYFARIIENGNEQKLCGVAYPLEFAETLLGASQSLFDPEAGVEHLPRRVAALSRFSAAVFGMDPATFDRIYEPLLS